ANEVVEMLRNAGVNARADLRDEKVNYKIRELSLAKPPIIAVVGEKEMADRNVTLRSFGVEKQESMSLHAFVEMMQDSVKMPL
ncbi:MAG: threonine--tRNA ligase, partial [Alphaproteobacteria bacterium]|nr:threonine--tRNA ligase [Alphaproteobacteria bacterium]